MFFFSNFADSPDVSHLISTDLSEEEIQGLYDDGESPATDGDADDAPEPETTPTPEAAGADADPDDADAPDDADEAEADDTADDADDEPAPAAVEPDKANPAKKLEDLNYRFGNLERQFSETVQSLNAKLDQLIQNPAATQTGQAPAAAQGQGQAQGQPSAGQPQQGPNRDALIQQAQQLMQEAESEDASLHDVQMATLKANKLLVQAMQQPAPAAGDGETVQQLRQRLDDLEQRQQQQLRPQRELAYWQNVGQQYDALGADGAKALWPKVRQEMVEAGVDPDSEQAVGWWQLALHRANRAAAKRTSAKQSAPDSAKKKKQQPSNAPRSTAAGTRIAASDARTSSSPAKTNIADLINPPQEIERGLYVPEG